MRRSASEIIHNLETRIAKLEGKTAAIHEISDIMKRLKSQDKEVWEHGENFLPTEDGWEIGISLTIFERKFQSKERLFDGLTMFCVIAGIQRGVYDSMMNGPTEYHFAGCYSDLATAKKEAHRYFTLLARRVHDPR